MAVVSVNEVSHGRRINDKYEREATSARREYVVIMNDVNDGPNVARTADDGVTAIPIKGAQHPDVLTVYVDSIDPQPTDSRLVWMVLVQYEYLFEPDPTDDDWDISWGFENVEEIIEQTRTNTGAGTWDVGADEPIENIVGDVFDPPLTENKARLVCTLIKNKSSFDVAQADAYINTMNSSSVTIAGHTAAKWAAKVIEYSGSEARRGETDYWIVKYRILFDRDTFVRKVLNVGWNKLEGSEPQKIKLALDGSTPDQAQKLDSAGALTDTAYYWNFGTLLEKAFGTLNLPTSM